MKRIVRLTESDLTRIVKRVIMEQKPSIAIGDKIKDRIEKTLEPTEDEKTFLSYVEKIKSSMIRIFDKTYFKPYDKEKDETESSFLTDIDNFKKIVTIGGGLKPVTNKNTLVKRIEYNEDKRWSGVDRGGMSDIKDFYTIMLNNGGLNKQETAPNLKTFNNKLKTLSTDIEKAFTNIKTAAQPPRMKSYQEREMDRALNRMKYGTDFTNVNLKSQQLMSNPWEQKPNYGLK